MHIKIVQTEKLVGNVYTDSRCRRIKDIIYGYVVSLLFHINNSYKIYVTALIFNL